MTCLIKIICLELGNLWSFHAYLLFTCIVFASPSLKISLEIFCLVVFSDEKQNKFYSFVIYGVHSSVLFVRLQWHIIWLLRSIIWHWSEVGVERQIDFFNPWPRSHIWNCGMSTINPILLSRIWNITQLMTIWSRLMWAESNLVKTGKKWNFLLNYLRQK